MNANKRMKYASTPTFGMQKRGFLKKPSTTQPTTMPDFSLLPKQELSGGSPQPSSYAPVVFPQGPAIPPLPPFQQTVPMQMPYGGTGFPMQPVPFSNPFSINSAIPQPYSNQPMPYPQMPSGAFAPQNRSFVPSSTQPPIQNYFPGNPPPIKNYPYPQASQPFTPMAGPTAQMYNPIQTNPNGSPGFNAMPQPPTFNNPSFQRNSISPGSIPAQPYYPQSAKASPDHDKLWLLFIFGVMPLLFIPCLLVPDTLNFLRYIFLALSVVGIGGIWYRQMFTPSTRTTVSILLTVLCVVVVSTLLNGAPDTQTGSNGQATTATTPTNAPVTEAPPEALAVAETPSPLSPPGTSAAGTRLSLFMDLWSAGGRVSEMVFLVQPNWVSSKENATSELFKLLANRTPLEYEIESISGTDMDSTCTITMTALIDKNNGKDPIRNRFTIVMDKVDDSWFVNPNTLVTNDVVKEEDVAAATTTIQMTLPPRMTETPVPLPSMPLYYNPDRGSFYHANQNCTRVDSKYLPLQGSFSYGELGSFSQLKPCLDCGAPINPLE